MRQIVRVDSEPRFWRVYESLGDEMDVQVTRVATPDMRIPAALILQRALLPTADKAVDAVERLLAAMSS